MPIVLPDEARLLMEAAMCKVLVEAAPLTMDVFGAERRLLQSVGCEIQGLPPSAQIVATEPLRESCSIWRAAIRDRTGVELMEVSFDPPLEGGRGDTLELELRCPPI